MFPSEARAGLNAVRDVVVTILLVVIELFGAALIVAPRATVRWCKRRLSAVTAPIRGRAPMHASREGT